MSEVIAVLVGVALTMVLTPTIERRVHARERWERDVLAFGEVLSQEVPRAREAVWHCWLSWDVLYQLADTGKVDRSSEQFAQMEKDALEKARPATNQLEDLISVQCKWMMLRIAKSAPLSFEREWLVYRMGFVQLTSVHGWTVDKRHEVSEAWDRERTRRAKLMKEVEALAAKIGPGPSLWTRVKRRWWSLRRRVTERRRGLLARFKRSG